MRYLRITFSVFCGALCLLVMFFWARSYWYADGGLLKLLPSEYIQFHTGDGRMCIWFEHKPIEKSFDWWSNPITEHTPPDAENRIPWFDLAFWPTFARLYMAHWVFVLATGFLAIIPWCPRKFSVRGMLMAMTFLAVIAALIGWVDRTF